jgi:formylglycine-generating enzyme required for sulfatase activity
VAAPAPAPQKEENHALANVSPLTAAQESALKPSGSFKECAECPEMVVVPPGRFLMGSRAGQGYDEERPQHEVTIAKPFAVAKFALTFDEWDACAAGVDCRAKVSDLEWGRGRRPVINVSWNDAQAYVKWLSSITGKSYRLLSEAEYEYAARAGTRTAYPWGPAIKLNGKPMANCVSCGSQWDTQQTAPVGSFPANAFGLYDMVGNVYQWTEDCWNGDYKRAPADGFAWTTGDCSRHAVRGSSFLAVADFVRSVSREWHDAGDQDADRGFRVARTLSP